MTWAGYSFLGPHASLRVLVLMLVVLMRMGMYLAGGMPVAVSVDQTGAFQ